MIMKFYISKLMWVIPWLMCVIGAIFSSGRSGNDVDDDY